MRIFRYLFRRKLAMLAVLVLLVGQAACDLALPAYTSQIVDVGIQQSGVEHVTCEVMTKRTHDEVAYLLSGDERALFDESYDEGDGLYRLNAQGRAEIGRLDDMLARPLVAIHSESASAPDADAVQASGGAPFAELASHSEGSLLHQRAISASIKEYEAAGYDLTGMQFSYLARVGGLMAAIAAAGMVLAILVSLVASRTGARIGRDLRRRLFSQVVSFSEREIGTFSAASLITRGTNDVQLVQNVSIMLMRMVLYAPILALGGIVMVMATSAELGWIVVVAVVVVFVVIGTLFALTMPCFKTMQKLVDKVNLVSREMLTGMPVVRAFGREAFEQRRFDVASAKLMRTQLFTNRAMAFMMPAMMLVMNLTSVAIVWFGGLEVGQGRLQTGDLIAFITYSMVIIMGFLMLGMMAVMLPRANVAAERVDAVIACEPSVRDAPDATPPAPPARGVRIEFEDVSFGYGGAGCENVLEGVSFVAEPGKTLAIIGATGAGKSTVLKLIERFYDVDEGSVTIDGVDVRDLPQARLRALLAYVPQKSFLFSGTIASNVAYGNEGADEGRIRDALRIAQADAFVREKAEGLRFEIAQGGTNVSGGQRQRLAIARALATDARALLLDDSFSSLDYRTDAALRRGLDEALPAVTRIVVAQRIATVMDADRIVVLEEGRVVGTGTHRELLRECAPYREIALSQLSEAELARGDGAA